MGVTSGSERGITGRAWRWALAAALVGAAAGCGARGPSDLTEYLPAQADIVVHADGRRVFKGDVFERIKKVRDASLPLRWGWDRLVKAGVDPERNVEEIVVGLTYGAETTDFGAVVRGAFVPRDVIAYFKEVAGKGGEIRTERHAGRDLHTATARKLALAVVSRRIVLVGTPAWVRLMLDRAEGKGPGVRSRPGFAALLGGAPKDQSIWGAAIVSDAARARAVKRDSVERLITGAVLGADLATGIRAQLTADCDSDAGPIELQKRLNGLVAQLRDMAEYFQPLGAEALAEGLGGGTKGKQFLVSLSVPMDKIELYLGMVAAGVKERNERRGPGAPSSAPAP
ncbi:MAG TPA: hypothetical protein VGQ83_25535 [Polyangia bacterium]